MPEEAATTTIRVSPSIKEKLEEEKKRRWGEVARRVSYDDVLAAILEDLDHRRAIDRDLPDSRLAKRRTKVTRRDE